MSDFGAQSRHGGNRFPPDEKLRLDFPDLVWLGAVMPDAPQLTEDQRDLIAHLCAEAGGGLEWISAKAVTIRDVKDNDLSRILDQIVADAENSILLLKAAGSIASQIKPEGGHQ